jgi:hypothetical protein
MRVQQSSRPRFRRSSTAEQFGNGIQKEAELVGLVKESGSVGNPIPKFHGVPSSERPRELRREHERI